MADVLLDGVEWLVTQQEAHAGRPLILSRKSSSVRLTGTVGTTLFKQTDTGGRLRMEHSDRDYLIRTATIILDGEATKPQRGDRIEDLKDGLVFELSSPGNEPCWRYSDQYGVRLRCHCKQVA